MLLKYPDTIGSMENVKYKLSIILVCRMAKNLKLSYLANRLL